MPWSRTAELVLNLSTRRGTPLVAGRTDAAPVEYVTWFSRDQFTLRLRFVESAAGGTLTPATLEAGSQILLKGNAKTTPGADPSLYSAAGFAAVADGGDTVYEATLNLNTTPGNAAVDALPQDQALHCLFDLEIQNAANTQRRTFQFTAYLKKDVARTQAAPDPGPVQHALLTTDADGINQKHGLLDVPSAAEAVAVAFTTDFPSIPGFLSVNLRAPSGSPGIAAWIDHSTVTDGGFTALLGAPTPNGNYKLNWLALR